MAQIEQYVIDQQTQHHHLPNTDPNHPTLSAVPTSPGPELDQKHYQLRQNNLPEPPLFSPPITNTTFDDISFGDHQDISIGTIDKSTEDLSGSINEPRTPESIAPSLDYIPFITSESDSLSVDHVGQPPEIIAKAQTSQDNRVQDQSEEIPQHLNDQSPASTSEKLLIFKADPQHKSVKPEESKLKSIQSTAEGKQINPPVANSPMDSQQVPLPLPEKGPRPKNVDTVNEIAPILIDDWLDISKTEFQFAIGLFAIPWSSLVIFSRSINIVWTLIFAQPLVQPITGALLSIIAPSLLYASLVALLVSSAAQIDW